MLADPDAVIVAARRWLGTPYHDQASLCGVGCDCLGLARGVWRDLIGAERQAIPPYSRDWGETGGHIVSVYTGTDESITTLTPLVSAKSRTCWPLLGDQPSNGTTSSGTSSQIPKSSPASRTNPCGNNRLLTP